MALLTREQGRLSAELLRQTQRIDTLRETVTLMEDRHQGVLRALHVPISRWHDRSACAEMIAWLRASL